MEKNPSQITSSAFDLYYDTQFGERWAGLKNALLHPTEKVLRSCFDGFATYRLDQASIRAAEALQVQSGDSVLDLCAAPGGKSLILAENLLKSGQLTANELSSPRRLRLREVLDTHVPIAVRSRLTVTGFDGNQFGLKKKNSFDRVLLDAPCSSEAHLLEEDPSQKDWKESRTKQLAMRQYSLLCSALLALKPGGTLVYSTCSISDLENDGVVERLLARKGDEVEVDSNQSDLEDLEQTQFGFRIFPDRSGGHGPIYFSRLKKRI